MGMHFGFPVGRKKKNSNANTVRILIRRMPSNSAFSIEGAYGVMSTTKHHRLHPTLLRKCKNMKCEFFSDVRWFLDGVFVWSVSRQREAVCKDS